MGRPHDIPRICVRDLEGYKKTLKVGQEKRIRVLRSRGADWYTWVKAVIMAVHKNVVLMRYRITVEIAGIRREATREEYVKISDLYIWEMGGRNDQ